MTAIIRAPFCCQDCHDRFWAKVNKTDDCWIWLGGTSNNRYGSFATHFKQRTLSSHRVSYEYHFGAIPQGLYVCHSCDNVLCVNPAHLFLGTAKDNQQDSKAKGRNCAGERNGRALVTPEIVKAIREEVGTLANIGAKYGIAISTVSDIRKHRTWQHI